MSHLEALEAVSVLGLFSYGIHCFIDDLGALSVVAFSVAIASTALAEDHVIGAEELSDGSSSNGIDYTRLEVDEDGSGHVAASVCFIIVHIDSLELQV